MIKKVGFALILNFFLIPAFAQNGHDISVKVHGMKDTTALLAFYYGNNTYLKDTGYFDSKGVATFKGDEPLPGGIYLFVLPNQNYFEFIINEQKFKLETDTGDMVKNMKVFGSKENEIFFDYLKFIGKERKEADVLKKQLDALSDDQKDEKDKFRKQLRDIDDAVKAKQKEIQEKYPESFYAKVLKMMQEPEIPDAPEGADSLWNYRYYKNHYFDNIDFSDDRLLRTPVFQEKIERYLNKLTIQIPDSINKATDVIMEKAKANDEMYKYLTIWITSHYERSKIMGMDEVFVHMAENYYLSDRADWVSDEQRKKIMERIIKIKPNIIGNVAPNMIMNDINGKLRALHDVDAKYTIIYFWDSNCGHCQAETPKLKRYYDSVNTQGVEIYAVNIESKPDDWKKYVKEHNLNWINVQDPNHQTNFRVNYDIYSTPVIYLLDKDKVILAKRLSLDQLRDMIKRLMKKDQAESKG